MNLPTDITAIGELLREKWKPFANQKTIFDAQRTNGGGVLVLICAMI